MTMRPGWLASSFVFVMMSPRLVLAQGRTWEMHPMMFVGGGVMILMMLVFWGLIVAGLVVGLRSLRGQGGPTVRDEGLQILRERYARGEIDKQEFDARKRELAA